MCLVTSTAPVKASLVGGIPTPLKNMKVNGKDDNPYIMENKKCLKPPSFPSFRAMCMLGPWSEALGAISTNWVQLWDYTCIPGHLAAAGSDARAPASLEHGLESSFASQLSTVVSACDAQGTEALCTKAVIISVWSTLGHSHNHGCFLPHGFEQLAEPFELLAK